MLFITEKDKRLIRRDAKLITRELLDSGKKIHETVEPIGMMVARRLELDDKSITEQEAKDFQNFLGEIVNESLEWYIRVKSKARISKEVRACIQDGKSPDIKNKHQFTKRVKIATFKIDHIIDTMVPVKYKQVILEWAKDVFNKFIDRHFLFRYFELRLEYKKYCAAIIREASKHMVNLTGIHFEDLSDGLPAVGSLSKLEWENFKENVRSALHAAADEIGLASNWRKDLIARYMKVLEKIKERYVRASQENESFLGSLAKMAAGLFLEHNLRKF